MITCSLLNVMKENPDGTVDGYWIQNHIGYVSEARKRADSINEVNSNKLMIVVVEKINSTTPALNYYTNLKRLDVEN